MRAFGRGNTGTDAHAITIPTTERVKRTYADGVVVLDADAKKLYVGDGVTAGGKVMETT